MRMVSVIIPVYNVVKYLPECINSVLRQSYKNYEIILIDDGSTDGSEAVCDLYGEKYENVHAFHKVNEGLGIARNYGLAQAKGDYVLFLDSDDYVKKDFVEVLCRRMEEKCADYCKSGFFRVDDSSKIVAIRKYDDSVFDKDAIKGKLMPRFFGSSPKNNDSVEMCVCACLFKRSIIEKNRLKFLSEREVLSEDIFFSIDYLKKIKVAYLSDYVGYYYRVNNGSLSHSYRADRFEKSKHLNRLLLAEARKIGDLGGIKNRIYKQFFINIRSSLAQERLTVSGLSFLESRHNIKRICCDNDVKKIISEYPINKLGIKQRIFIWLIKRRLVTLLMLFINFGVI